MAHVLALDVGTSSIRAQLYDERGRPVEDTLERVETGVGETLGEADAGELLEAALEVVERARGSNEVGGAGISCFWHSLVPVDGNLDPLGPVLTWEDVRAAPQADRLAAEIDARGAHERTGCPLHPSYWPSKLRWLAEERQDAFSKAAYFFSFADLVFHRLTGELGTSLSIASSTGLLDVNELSWDAELLTAGGIEASRLPPVLDDATAYDGWFPPVGDGACSNVGAGCVSRDRAALMIGTSGAYRVVYETDRVAVRPGLFCYRVDDRRVTEGGSVSDGGNLPAWLEKTLALEGEPELAEPDGHGLTFLTLLGGERSPGWRGGARGTLHGLTFATTSDQILQAGLEGVAFRLAEIAALMPEVKEIVATGGALRRQSGWTQIVADALGRPLVVSGVEESSARGAAVLALERLGIEADPAPLGETVEPRPEGTEAYRAARERQRRLYETLA